MHEQCSEHCLALLLKYSKMLRDRLVLSMNKKSRNLIEDTKKYSFTLNDKLYAKVKKQKS